MNAYEKKYRYDDKKDWTRDGENVSDRQRVCEKCEETIVRKK